MTRGNPPTPAAPTSATATLGAVRPAAPTTPFDGVVILSPFAWDGAWQTPHYVARQLGRHVPVVFAEKPATWSPGDADFALARLRRRSRVRVESTSISVVSPKGLPLSRLRTVRGWAIRSFGATLAGELKRQQIRNPLGWISYFAGCTEYLETIANGAYVYHCLDAFDSAEESELARRAAAVFAVSRRLYERHAASNPNTFHVPNGIDAQTLAARPPSAWSARTGRVIGFVGILNRHIDFTLLEKIARAFTNDHLVLGGPVLRGASAPSGEQRAAMARLRRLPNVRFAGFVEPALVPRLVESFSVGIIPFLADAFNAGRDPIKFYQYFAQGKAVVTTSVAVAEENATLCQLGDSHADFLAGIDRALSSTDDGAPRARIELARRHTWEALARRAIRSLEAVGIHLRRTP